MGFLFRNFSNFTPPPTTGDVVVSERSWQDVGNSFTGLPLPNGDVKVMSGPMDPVIGGWRLINGFFFTVYSISNLVNSNRLFDTHKDHIDVLAQSATDDYSKDPSAILNAKNSAVRDF